MLLLYGLSLRVSQRGVEAMYIHFVTSRTWWPQRGNILTVNCFDVFVRIERVKAQLIKRYRHDLRLKFHQIRCFRTKIQQNAFGGRASSEPACWPVEAAKGEGRDGEESQDRNGRIRGTCLRQLRWDVQTPFRPLSQQRTTTIDREFVTSAKKFANFNEFSEIKKIRKNSYKNSLNARVGVAFQWNSLLI